MCGIAGFISDNRFLEPSQFSASLHTLITRGPDFLGQYSDPKKGVWLGHSRLAILDLSESGNQPMETENGQYVLVFNGEIYNYREIKQELLSYGVTFRSNSDTEVVLRAWEKWGESCLTQLKGMFAFCIWDNQDETAYLVRDRAGEKPLYYQLDNKELIFGSEQSVFAHLSTKAPVLSYKGLIDYLNYGYTLGANCLLDGVKKLLPGHYLKWRKGDDVGQVSIFYTLPKNHIENFNMKLTLDELDRSLESVIQDQLVADVPVGLLLSGGLDSSLIAAYASKIHPEIESFTVVFPDFKKNDESGYARDISTRFGTNHRTVEADHVDLDGFIHTIENCESPVSDPAFYPTFLLSKEIRKYCKVALSGDGADEIFGGYERYQDWINLKLKSESFPPFVSKAAIMLAENVLPIGFRGRQKLLQLRTDFTHELPAIPVLFQDFELRGLLKPDFYKSDGLRFKLPEYKDGDYVDAILRHDFSTFLSENILTKVDRSSMMCSLEIRAPFLDQRILDLVFGKVPSDKKVNSVERKIMLKELARRKLPENYNFHRKQGFVPPIEKWFQNKDWDAFIKQILLGKGSIFNPVAIEKLISGQEKGRFNKRRIYSLLVLQIYLVTNKLI